MILEWSLCLLKTLVSLIFTPEFYWECHYQKLKLINPGASHVILAEENASGDYIIEGLKMHLKIKMLITEFLENHF